MRTSLTVGHSARRPPIGVWASGTTINFVALPGTSSTVRLTFQDSEQRTFNGTLAWDIANGVAELGYDEAASQGNDKLLYFYYVPKAANDKYVTVLASDNAPAVGPVGYANWILTRVSYISAAGVITQSVSQLVDEYGYRYFPVRGEPGVGKVPLWNAAGYLEFTRRAYGFYSMVGNGTAVALTATVPAKVAGTTTAGTLVEFTHSNNRLTYTGAPTRTFHVVVTLCLEFAASGSIVSCYVAKGGTVIAASQIETRIVNAGDHKAFSCQAQVSLATNEYIEVFVSGDKSADCIVDDLQVYVRET